MPIVSTFYGITVRIYVPDHNPPHVHVSYAEFTAVIEIRTGKLLSGQLPSRSLKLFEEWRKIHVDELIAAFNDATNMTPPGRIDPLD